MYANNTATTTTTTTITNDNNNDNNDYCGLRLQRADLGDALLEVRVLALRRLSFRRDMSIVNNTRRTTNNDNINKH